VFKLLSLSLSLSLSLFLTLTKRGRGEPGGNQNMIEKIESCGSYEKKWSMAIVNEL
jgi:hypothetical protein